MIGEKITSIIDSLKSGGQSAPLLVSEEIVCEISNRVFGLEISSIEELEVKSIPDFLSYDCSDTKSKHHGVEKTRAFVEKLYQKPAGEIMIVIFLNIDALNSYGYNALLKIFEDVPHRLLILITSQAPEKIIPTLQSRIINLNMDSMFRGENPLQNAIDDFITGKHEALFNLTLGKEFKKEQALWVVTGLQNAVLNGTLSPRNAGYIRETRLTLETTNTIAKYLIDRLLIALLCE